MRLVGSSLRHEGRLEVRYGAVWGTVCDDLFDYIDAGVVCSSLGLGLVLILIIYINHSSSKLVMVDAQTPPVGLLIFLCYKTPNRALKLKVVTYVNTLYP